MRRLTGPLCGRRRVGSNDQFRTIPAIGRPAATIPAAHGPHVHPRRRAVPRRVPGLARGQRAPARRCRRATPATASPRTSSGSARCSTPRYAVVSWPREYGGRDASLWEWLIFEEEYYAAGAPQRVTQNGIFLLAPTIFEFGTPGAEGPHPARRWPSGEQTWCQGWSEPNAGSDLAGIQSKARARRRGAAAGGSSGQKTWTTRGAFCTHLFGLFRSDPDAERHHGLTYFLVDLATPGVTVRGVERLDGDEGFAEVFLDDVFVPDADVLGEPNQGWAVAMATTGSERGLTLRSPGRFMATAQRLIDLARTHRDDAEATDAARPARPRRGSTPRRTAGRRSGPSRASSRARAPGAESSMVKVFWSELDVRLHELALDLLGPHAELLDGDDAAWMKGYEFALAGPIYAGTNEIQRNVIAERVLGLPRQLDACASPSPTSSSRSATRCATCSRRSARPRTCAPRGRTRPAASPACGTSSPRWAWSGCSRPKPSGGLGLTLVDLVLVLEETGRYAVPEPIVETAAFGRAAARPRRPHGRGGRTARCRGPTPPTSSSPRPAGSSAPTVELVAAPVGRRRPPPVRGAGHAGAGRRRRACSPRTTAACAESPRSSAGWPIACSR